MEHDLPQVPCEFGDELLDLAETLDMWRRSTGLLVPLGVDAHPPRTPGPNPDYLAQRRARRRAAARAARLRTVLGPHVGAVALQVMAERRCSTADAVRCAVARPGQHLEPERLCHRETLVAVVAHARLDEFQAEVLASLAPTFLGSLPDLVTAVRAVTAPSC